MGLFQIITVLMVLTALFSYLNSKTIRLPTTIGVMLISMLISLSIAGMGLFGMTSLQHQAMLGLQGIDFNEALLHGMLSFLLFAGALQLKFDDLASQKWTILLLSTVGVIASALIVGGLTRFALQVMGITLPFAYCLLFGALISPTDPVAVIGILKTAGVPKSLETKIAGESLFNDGIGVVVFMVILELTKGGSDITFGRVSLLFLKEAVGGACIGIGSGYLAYRMLKWIDNYKVEAIITLALAMGSYSLADGLGASGPIAVVIAGLFIGNTGRSFAMSDITRERLDSFWELIDEILNALLFMLVGLEVQVMSFAPAYLAAGVVAIGIALFARWMSVLGTISLMRFFRSFEPGVVRILTWSGLRGGIAVALALSLPSGPERTVILVMTYVIVVFSILVQGLTLGRLVERIYPNIRGDGSQ